MARGALSTKRLQIDKANASIVAMVAVSAFLVVFCLFAAKALLSQRSYQAKVIHRKRTALTQLKANNEKVGQLVNSYHSFTATDPNIINGSKDGSGDRDGDNARIILDALPSKYDFPALTTSIEKILTDGNYKINEISGTDDEVNQQNAGSSQPVEMPFQVSVSGSYEKIRDLVGILERSIRPINAQKIELSGSDGELKLILDAKTHYLPARQLDIKKEVVK